jgi:hypothetical protein
MHSHLLPRYAGGIVLSTVLAGCSSWQAVSLLQTERRLTR